MAKRVPISIFLNDLVSALNRKDGYIMGARGQNPRTGKLDLKSTAVSSSWKVTGWYYQQYNDRKKYSKAQYDKALYWRSHSTRVWDCNGLAEGIYEIHTGINIDSKARYNYSQWCDPKGSGIIPAKYRMPGAAVFWSDSGASNIHHVGYLWKPVVSSKPDGDWYLIEARGVGYGVVCTKLLSRKPNYWGLMTKYYDYSGAAASIPQPVEYHLGDRELKNGMEGNDVKELQTNLIRLDFDCGKWGADGDFGDCTEEAVRTFQKAYGLKVTGVFTKIDLEVMEKKLSDDVDAPVENPKAVVIKGGQCYIRTKASTDGAVIGVAKEGTEWEYAGETAQNGWIKIKISDKTVGWVSGKYGKLEA